MVARSSCWLSACCVVLSFLSAGTVSAADPPADSPQVKQLLKERLAILTTIYEERSQAHKQGLMSLDRVQDAQQALLEAKLELCETKAQRLAIHEEFVSLARQTAQVVEALAKAAEVPHDQLLSARLRLLEAQIRLERTKAEK
jgi:hypothetical protein